MSSLKYTGLGFLILFLFQFTVVSNVKGQVTVGFTYEQFCDSLVFTDASTPIGATVITNYEWSFGGGGTATGPVVSHIFSGQGSFNVELKVTYENPVGQATYNEDIEIWHVNNATITSDPSVCNNISIVFAGSANSPSSPIDPDSLKWDFENDDIFDAFGSPVSFTYPAPGNYVVKLRAINGKNCFDEKTKAIEVLEGPEAAFSADTACLGNPTNFTNESIPVGGAIINQFFWDFQNDGIYDAFVESPSFTYPSAGIFDVKLKVISDQGCPDSVINPVKVNLLPVADFSYDSQCPELPVQFSNLTVPNAGGDVTYLWDFGDGATSDLFSPQHTYTSNGLYNVMLQVTNSNGCMHDTIKELLIEKPISNFDFDIVCFGFETSFTDQSTFTTSPIVSWNWDFGDFAGTSTQQSPSYTYGNYGVYDVSLIVENELGCSDDSIISVLVDTIPIAFFTYDASCVGEQTCFNDESQANADTIISWTWNFGDGIISILNNPCHIFADTGYHTVSLVVVNSDGCESEPYEETIYVAGQPQANFSALTSCFGDTTYFVNLTDSFGTKINSWLWDFGDPGSMGNNTSTLFEPNHYFTNPGIFNVSLTAENIYGCIDNYQQTFTIDSLPEANFSIPDTIASGIEITIIDNSIGYGSPVVIRNWDFGDGTTATNINPIQHTYDTPGSYVICLSVEDFNGCTDDYCDTIVISEHPVAAFTYASDVTFETFLFDESQPNNTISDWYWDFGDLTTSLDTATGIAQPTWTYPEEGWYQVYLKVWDRFGGSDDVTQMVYAGNAVIADFENYFVCLGDTTMFIDNSYSPISAGFETWYWDFGDGNDSVYYEPQDTLYHRYMFPGVYEVRFGLSANVYGFFMSDTMHRSIEVFEYPFARIDTAGIGVCLGEEISFKDGSIYVPNDPGAIWDWDFQDGSTATVKNPVHLYADTGIYYVTLQIMSQHGCAGIDSAEAHVNFAPDFDFLIKNPCLNNPATFIPDYDSSKIEITSWNWNFGDHLSPDNISTISHPQHVYTRIDNYTVTMKMSSYGCSGESEQNILVYPIPFSDFKMTSDYGGVQGRVKFENNSVFATHYLWDFGNGNTSSVPEPIEVYEYDSTYTVTLVSYNDYPVNTTDDFKCTDTSTYKLTVFFKGLYFPTAFSPNNPNTEISRFTPKGVNLLEYKVQVFDMRGNLMWESEKLDEYGTPMESWDGYADGVLMPQGMYVWKATGLFRDGSIWQGQSFNSKVDPQTNGVVTLIH